LVVTQDGELLGLTKYRHDLVQLGQSFLQAGVGAAADPSPRKLPSAADHMHREGN